MTQQMPVFEHRPFGLVTDEVDVGDVGSDQAGALAQLIATCGVVVFRNQSVDDAAFVRLLHLLGPMTFTPGETPLSDQPMLNAVSHVGRATPPRSVFHTDSSYLPAPPAYTALRAVSVPSSGGATLFSDQYAAAERLSSAMRDDLAQRTIQHSVTGVAGHEETHRHPLLRRHRLTGRVALYLSTPGALSRYQRFDAGTQPARGRFSVSPQHPPVAAVRPLLGRR